MSTPTLFRSREAEMSSMLVLTEGRFGEEVGRRIEERVPRTTVRRLTEAVLELPALLRGVTFVSVAAWRPYRWEMDRIDEACFRVGMRWSSAVLSGTSLLSGPLVDPLAGGPCFSCYTRRWRTHLAVPEREAAIEAAYAQDASLGVEGFLPGHAALAAAGLLLDCRAAGRRIGALTITDLLSLAVDDVRVVPVHDCARCSRNSSGIERYVKDLKTDIEGLVR